MQTDWKAYDILFADEDDPAMTPPEWCKANTKPMSIDVEGYNCGGWDHWTAEIADATPVWLYRALWLFEPIGVSFGDMYKGFLFGFTDVEERFQVSVEWWKYSLALRFACDKVEDVGGRRGAIIAGCPGSDNGVRCDNPEGVRFFGAIVRMILTTWRVYGGNDFSV